MDLLNKKTCCDTELSLKNISGKINHISILGLPSGWYGGVVEWYCKVICPICNSVYYAFLKPENCSYCILNISKIENLKILENTVLNIDDNQIYENIVKNDTKEITLKIISDEHIDKVSDENIVENEEQVFEVEKDNETEIELELEIEKEVEVEVEKVSNLEEDINLHTLKLKTRHELMALCKKLELKINAAMYKNEVLIDFILTKQRELGVYKR